MDSTLSRQKSQYRSHWYGKDCLSHDKASGATILTQYEEVTSYRGPHRYIDVGSKRRRAFHAFNKYSYVVPESECFCCPAGSSVSDDCYHSFSFPWRQLGDKRNWADDMNGNPIDVEYSKPLLVTQPQLSEYGEGLREHVIRDLYVKCNKPRYDVAVVVAELDETLADIWKLFVGCAKSWHKTSQAVRYLKHFSLNSHELWLWYRYMLVPTMLDVEDLVKAITSHEKIDRIQDGDRIEDEIVRGEATIYGFNFAPNLDLKLPYEMKINAGLGGALDIVSRHDPSEWGTSAYDLVRASWERIPFSFVADWFVNIGDWLTSLRSLEVNFAQSYATYAVDVETTFKNGDFIWLSDEPVLKSFQMDRIVNVEPPALPLIDKRWASVTRYIDLISLSIGILKGILKRR